MTATTPTPTSSKTPAPWPPSSPVCSPPPISPRRCAPTASSRSHSTTWPTWPRNNGPPPSTPATSARPSCARSINPQCELRAVEHAHHFFTPVPSQVLHVCRPLSQSAHLGAASFFEQVGHGTFASPWQVGQSTLPVVPQVGHGTTVFFPSLSLTTNSPRWCSLTSKNPS